MKYPIYAFITHVCWIQLSRCSLLQVCDMSGNILNCSSRHFSAFPDLSELDISVTVLDFRNNEISRLQDIDVASNNLISDLILQGNGISLIDDAAFSSLKHLRHLDLSRNQLTQNETAASKFSGLENLTILNLTGNPIGYLVDLTEASLFSLSLSELYLSDCQLQTIGEHALQNSQALFMLDLSHNNLRGVDYWYFLRSISLHTLDLSFNLLTYFNTSALPNLTKLNLSNNNFDNFNLRGDTYLQIPKLETLDLSANIFSDIPSGALIPEKSLKNLYLSENPITVIHAIPRPVEGFTISAEVLRLNDMTLLTEITDIGFQRFRKLREVHISNNHRLSIIGKEAFGLNFKTIKKVNMENNNISTLSEFLLPWNDLESLKLGSNPWKCDQSLCWMIKKKTLLVKFEPNITCVSPQHFYGRDILSLLLHDLNCSAVSIPPVAMATSKTAETDFFITSISVLSLIGSSVAIMYLLRRRRRLAN